MAEKAGEEGACAPGGVRGSLVTSLAANIFDTLKSNDDIALILTGVLDPARDDKEDLMKHLMSTINTTLQVGGDGVSNRHVGDVHQDSLLRNSRGGSLHSDGLTPDTSEDSMRCSYTHITKDNRIGH